MASKKLSLYFSLALKQDLCAAIRLYAEAAYPPGGSECAQVAHETLLEAAHAIDEQFATSGRAEVSSRLRGQLNAALDYYADVAGVDGSDIATHISLLRSALKGGTVRED